jgi:hypothetical protein
MSKKKVVTSWDAKFARFDPKPIAEPAQPLTPLQKLAKYPIGPETADTNYEIRLGTTQLVIMNGLLERICVNLEQLNRTTNPR